MLSKRLTDAIHFLLQGQKDFSVTKLPGDASNRSYYRLHTTKQSYIVMVLAETGANSLAEEVTKVSRVVTELPFIDIQRYLSHKGVKVPHLFGYDEKHGVLLLEDLGDQLLLEATQTAAPAQIQRWYETALGQLECLAIISCEDLKQSIAFSRSFDEDLYNWEFLHFVEYGLDHRLKKPPKNHDRDKIVSSLKEITREYLSWEKVFCHRDYHSRNLLVFDSQIAVIDFQDALLAPLFYDLASLLRDSYFALEDSLQDTLVESYRKQMASHGLAKTSSREEFRRAFDLMGLHRNLKAAGRFCYIDQVKGNRKYLADVPRTLRYVKKTLERYKDLITLKNTLFPYIDDIIESCQ